MHRFFWRILFWYIRVAVWKYVVPNCANRARNRIHNNRTSPARSCWKIMRSCHIYVTNATYRVIEQCVNLVHLHAPHTRAHQFVRTPIHTSYASFLDFKSVASLPGDNDVIRGKSSACSMIFLLNYKLWNQHYELVKRNPLGNGEDGLENCHW